MSLIKITCFISSVLAAILDLSIFLKIFIFFTELYFTRNFALKHILYTGRPTVRFLHYIEKTKLIELN